MTFRSALQQARRLACGDPKAWTYLPYQLRMKIHGIDLSWVSVKESGLCEERSHWHSNSGGPDLDKLLQTMTISGSNSVLDIGCGKGGAILTLAQYPFSRVDGVEISPNLARIARENVKRMGVSNAEIFCCDAAEFSSLDLYDFFYMYNPFPEAVMRRVMENIGTSVARRQRNVTLIYKNPIFGELVICSGFRKVSETQQTHPHYPPFCVYEVDHAHTAMRRSA